MTLLISMDFFNELSPILFAGIMIVYLFFNEYFSMKDTRHKNILIPLIVCLIIAFLLRISIRSADVLKTIS